MLKIMTFVVLPVTAFCFTISKGNPCTMYLGVHNLFLRYVFNCPNGGQQLNHSTEWFTLNTQ